jgi:hypothetical protein
MEVWGASGEAAEDRSLDLTDMSELAVNQGWPRSVVVLQLLLGCPLTSWHTVICGR